MSKYKVKINEVTYQIRKGLSYPITPYCKFSITDSESRILAHIPDFVKDKEEVANMIVEALNK